KGKRQKTPGRRNDRIKKLERRRIAIEAHSEQRRVILPEAAMGRGHAPDQEGEQNVACHQERGGNAAMVRALHDNRTTTVEDAAGMRRSWEDFDPYPRPLAARPAMGSQGPDRTTQFPPRSLARMVRRPCR